MKNHFFKEKRMNCRMRVKCIVLFVCCFHLILTGADVDPTDYTLIAYELIPQQEEQFDYTDGKVSEFWMAWEGPQAGELDYVHEIPETHGAGAVTAGDPEINPEYDSCYYIEPGFTDGIDDAQLFIRAAWGEKGLYLYAETLDDLFVGLVADPEEMATLPPWENQSYVGAEQWMNDCFDFALDIYNSEEQKSHFIDFPSQLTRTFRQYQFRYSTPSQPAIIARINYIDPQWPDMCLPQTNGQCWPLKMNQYAIEEIRSDFGILFEVLDVGANRRAQEWCIPWSEIGTGITKPAAGTRCAVSFGYNDIDATETAYIDDLDVLSFKNRGNEFTHRERAERCGFDGNWGDIEFGGQLNEIAPLVAVSGPMPPPKLHSAENTFEFFSIAGKKIRADNVKAITVPGFIVAGNRTGVFVKVSTLPSIH
jgi:hypothetical protein